MNRPTDWEIIFAASPVNGGTYYGEYLPVHPWDWPRGTWLQERLRKLKEGDNETADQR